MEVSLDRVGDDRRLDKDREEETYGYAPVDEAFGDGLACDCGDDRGALPGAEERKSEDRCST